MTRLPTSERFSALIALLEQSATSSGQCPMMRNVWRSFLVLSSVASGNADTHSAPVRIYGRDLTWLATQHVGVDLSPRNLAHDIRVALRLRAPTG